MDLASGEEKRQYISNRPTFVYPHPGLQDLHFCFFVFFMLLHYYDAFLDTGC